MQPVGRAVVGPIPDLEGDAPTTNVIDHTWTFAAGSLLHQPVVVADAGQKEPARTELGEHVVDRQTQIVVLEQVRQRVVAGKDDVELAVDLRG